jgi:hypothetical protein
MKINFSWYVIKEKNVSLSANYLKKKILSKNLIAKKGYGSGQDLSCFSLYFALYNAGTSSDQNG